MQLSRKGLTLTIAVLILMACSSKLTEEEYYNAAKESYSTEKYAEAIGHFKDLVKNYPDGKRNAEAMFMLGFINANDLKDLKEAEKFYKEFIAKYPNHDLSDDAQYELQTLGKDINDLPFFKNLGADSTE
jgi:TolA-binding protein